MLYEVYHEAGILSTLCDSAHVIYPHDARAPSAAIPDGSRALVVTSPPYFNAVDYPRAHRMSVGWMNGYAPIVLSSRRHYSGLRHAGGFAHEAWWHEHPKVLHLLPRSMLRHAALTRRLCAFFADLEAVLGQVWRVLRPGGHAVFVIANNMIKGERITSHAVLTESANNIGFIAVETMPRAIASLRRRFPVGPFGFDGPMTHEFLVVLRKPL